MANLPGGDRLEFMIKLYPGGRFSGLLQDGSIKPGDELEVTGPYGVFTLRTSSPRRLLFIGGGAGMAPILSLLRAIAGRRERARGDLLLRRAHRGGPVPPRGARRAAGIRSSRRCRRRATAGQGEAGLITDVVDRLEGDITEVDAYVCGPPPMVEAAIALLEAKGVPEAHIYFDKFTTTAEE